MTRCAREPECPEEGFAWKPPSPLQFRVETERLLLRPYEPADVEPLFEAVNASREALVPWLPWARSDHRVIASTMRYVSSQIMALTDTDALIAGGLGVAITDKTDGSFVGGTGFHDLRRDSASCEIGYWIRADRHGQGLCTEAVRHWIAWLLETPDKGGLGLNRIRIFCSADNTPSARVPEKLGLRAEVRQRLDYHVPGYGVTDRLGWGVLAEEWDAGGRE